MMNDRKLSGEVFPDKDLSEGSHVWSEKQG
jgi:hypothetical protein